MHFYCDQGLAAALPRALAEVSAGLARLPREPLPAARWVVGHEDPLVVNTALMLALATLCYVFFLLTDNCSHVDRLWSIVPPFYVTIFGRQELLSVARRLREGGLGAAAGATGQELRLVVGLLLVGAWATRLTYNFYRKGGYRLSFEDYRWPAVRRSMPRLAFHALNLFFVALAQHALLLAINLPAHINHISGASRPFGMQDAAAAGLMALFLGCEAAADEQQWSFHLRKHQAKASGPAAGTRRANGSGAATSAAAVDADVERGFLSTGFFRFSRHPSWFCEYSFWWSFYLLCGALPSGCWLGWAVAGPIGLMVLLHFGSLWITERMSLEKYPLYATYRRTTSAVIPWLPGPPLPPAATKHD